MTNLAAPPKALELSNRERCRAGDHPIDHEAPIGETVFLQALERCAQRSHFICERSFRDLASRELTSQRVTCQDSLRRIGQRFSRAIQAASIGGNQSVAPCKPRCYREAGPPCHQGNPTGEESAS